MHSQMEDLSLKEMKEIVRVHQERKVKVDRDMKRIVILIISFAVGWWLGGLVF